MSQTPPDAGGDPDAQESPQQDGSTPQDQPQQDRPEPPDTSTVAQDSGKERSDPPATEQQVSHPSERQVDDGGQNAIVRYGLLRNLGQFRHNLDTPPAPGTRLVVRTERGVEIGKVVANVGEESCYGCVGKQDLEGYLLANGSDYPFKQGGRVLRRANQQDVIDHRHLQSSAREEAAFCRTQIDELELQMKLVSVEHLLGGERIIFNFSAESRVDFRELVKRLAREYRTRIEMRQVGARDEARLLADYERCGMRCCCQQFIKDLKPVSMRMAKLQKATLDPTKISGRCGRLMCCLRFEDAGYEELRGKLPKKNTWVRTEQYIGRVTETHTLTQLVRLDLPDSTKVVVANEEIAERDLPEPDREEAQRIMAAARAAARQAPPVREDEAPAKQPRDDGEEAPVSKEAVETAPEGSPAQQKRKKRRRRRRRRGGQGEAQGERQGAPATDSGPQGPPRKQEPTQAAAQKGKTPQASSKSETETKQTRKPKRRRRRRRKKPAS
jgi:cell fate regulator YaaT (PSP1 superfamily)